MMKLMLFIFFIYFFVQQKQEIYYFMFIFMMMMMGFEKLNCFWMMEDIISYFLILLSVYVCLMSLMVVYGSEMSKGYSGFTFSMMMIMSLLFYYYFFMMSNLMYFYLVFEFSMVPILVMIIRFGYQPERWRAGMYLIFYTFFSSVPLFMFILVSITLSLSSFFMSEMMLSVGLMEILLKKSFWFSFSFLAFLTKLPIYGVHIWLPKAHVEAPVSGSLLLAGVLLKLGGYGLLRFLYIIKMNSFFFFCWGLVGGLMACMVTFRQSDVKCYVAYTSVGHMGYVICGLFSYMSMAGQGSVIMMLSHGVVSCLMFYLMSVFYSRLFTRNFLNLSGVSGGLFYMGLIMFLCFVLNMSVPPFLGFMSEIGLIVSFSCWGGFYVWMMIIFIFQMVGALSLYYFIVIFHGISYDMKLSLMCFSESYCVLGMVVPSFLGLFFYSSFF